MTWSSVAKRPDLQPLFGVLSADENDRLLNRLLTIDRDLVTLAVHASEYVGIPYKPLALQLHVRPDGITSVGIDGGPSGDAGDIWFDISPAGSLAGPPRIIESRLVVFCRDAGAAR